ncbi:MAG TPA: flagellar motor switch protein FliM [Candidatus Saccharimonadales bacterium]|nr:flagellar motor switch protein FliM [Candidatus Saccharimonadales bacterium]
MNPDSSKPGLPQSLTSFLDAKQFASPNAPKNEPVRESAPPVDPVKKDGAQPYDFRNPMLLTPRELRKLRSHQEEFVQSLAARLSIQLRLEFSLELTSLQTIAYQKMAGSWANPAHLTMFKTEPLRGVSILEISHHLGACMVDRLMGGPGLVPVTALEVSEIEKVLLEQSVQLIIDEWCHHWAGIKDLKPFILGYESNGRYVQTASADTVMLVICMKASLGECVGRIQIGFPYAALEPLIAHFNQGAETMAPAPSSSSSAGALKWNPCFDEVRVPVTAEWAGLEMTAREVLALKVGDILPMDSEHAQQINLRLADILKFQGRPGKIAGQWAVEITNTVKR